MELVGVYIGITKKLNCPACILVRLNNLCRDVKEKMEKFSNLLPLAK
jgi:hypothetical protein